MFLEFSFFHSGAGANRGKQVTKHVVSSLFLALSSNATLNKGRIMDSAYSSVSASSIRRGLFEEAAKLEGILDRMRLIIVIKIDKTFFNFQFL